MKWGGKIEIAILALTLAIQLTKMIREKQAHRTIRIKERHQF